MNIGDVRRFPGLNKDASITIIVFYFLVKSVNIKLKMYDNNICIYN